MAAVSGMKWWPWSLECKHVWAHISGYLDATLPAEVLEQVEKHLEPAAYFAVQPPSITMSVPVMKPAISEHK